MATLHIHQTETFKNWLTSTKDSTSRICLARQISQTSFKESSNTSSDISRFYTLEFECLGRNWRLPYAFKSKNTLVMYTEDDPLLHNSDARRTNMSTPDMQSLPFEISDYLLNESDVISYLEILLKDADVTEIHSGIEHVTRAKSRIESSSANAQIVKQKDVASANALLKVVRKLEFFLNLERDVAHA